MALKHDAQGFLVGDPIDLSKAFADWAAIRDDVRAIRRSMHGIQGVMSRAESEARTGVTAMPGRGLAAAIKEAGTGLQEADPTVKAFQEVAQPMARGYELLTGGRDAESAAAVTRAVAELRAARPCGRPAQPRGRDDKGRFIRAPDAERKPAKSKKTAADKKKAGDEKKGATDEGKNQDGAVNTLPERLATAIKETGTGLQDADPTVKAFQEVAQPMARGYELLTGGDRQKKQERWLRRIWTTLTGFRKEGGLFNKIVAKRLKSLDEKPTAKEGGGGGLLSRLFAMLFGMFGMRGVLGRTLASLPILGHFFGGKKVVGAGAAAKGAGGAAKEAGAAAKEAGLLGKAGGLFKKGGALSKIGKLFKRIPLIGALLSGLGAASDIHDSETDDTLTRREKDQKAGTAVGGFAGAMTGMSAGAAGGAALGTLIFPGVGTAIGGAIGAAVGMFLGEDAGKILGETVGGWVNDLRAADIPGKISDAWQTTTAFLQGAWTEVKVRALGTWDWVESGWDSVAGVLRDGWDTAMSGFSVVGDTIKKAWGGFVDTAKAGWNSISNVFTSAYEGLKSLPVIGPAIKAAEALAGKVAEVAGEVKDGVVEVGEKAVAAIKSGASFAWNATKDAAGNAWDKATAFFDWLVPQGLQEKIEARRAMEAGQASAPEAASIGRGAVQADKVEKPAGNWVLGQTSRVFESGNGGAGTVSSGKGDFGGASYGTYQLSSAAGTLQKFLSSNKYGEQFVGLKPGTPDFNAKWKELAKTDPSFGDAQHAFIQATHYAPALSGLKKAGIDLSQRGPAVQDALWSSSVQFGAGSEKRKTGAIGVFQKALAGRDIATMSEKDIVAAVQDYKIANNERLFARSDADHRASTAKRAVAEKMRLIALADGAAALAQPAAQALVQSPAPVVPTGIAAPAAPVVAAASVPTVPAAPVVPPIADAPPVAVPIAGADAHKPVAVALVPAEVGQDLRERGIAHIATGGLSGGA